MINRVAVCIIIVLYIHDTERGLLMEKLKTFDVDLKRLFFEVLKRLWLILLVGIVCGSGVFLYAKFFITPQYKATATIYIQNYFVAWKYGVISCMIFAARSSSQV